jgi:hypothetical protein
VRSRPDRVTHIMQTIKDCNQIVISAWEFFRLGNFEANAVGDSVAPGKFLGRFNRLVVIVESEELRVRECF